MRMPFVCPHSATLLVYVLFFCCCLPACLLRCHFPFGCILNPVIKNQFLDSHISFDRMIINGIEWEKSIRVCSQRRNKNYGLIGWGVFCNFKLPHICYQQCELVFRTCVILFITGNFSCSHCNAGFLLLSFENRLKKYIYWLMRIYNFNELVLRLAFCDFLCYHTALS